jgi:hypothetical protein
MKRTQHGHAALLADLHALPAFIRRQAQRRQAGKPILFIKSQVTRNPSPPVIPKRTAATAATVEELKASLASVLDKAVALYQAGKISAHQLVKFENHINRQLDSVARTGRLA